MNQTAITIRTNNVPRDVINAWELTAAEQAQFDYLDWEAIEDGRDSAQFFRYRGELYDLSQFSRVIHPDAQRAHPMECSEPAFQGWDGYMSDSFFSGMLIRWAHDENGHPDFERVIVGVYCS
jgi:hypothetical protein